MVPTVPVAIGDLVFDVQLAGPEDGTPVVLLHGFPQTGRCWSTVAAALAADGLRVIVPDQRGYSPGARPPEVSDYEISALAADIVGVLEALGLESAHMVGHDWGASVAWYLAAHHADRVRTLTALSVSHLAAFGWAMREDADQRARSSYFTLLRQEGKAEDVLLADDAQRLRAMYGTGVDAAAIDSYVAALSTPRALTAALNWYRAMTRSFGELPAVRVPTTYVWSTGDTALGRAAAERCGEFVDADYEFVVLDGVSHWLPEEAPGEVATAIRRRIAAPPANTLER